MRMMRLSPYEEPRECPGSYCSMPITLRPRCARAHNVAAPIAPKPTTTTSRLCIASLYMPPNCSVTANPSYVKLTHAAQGVARRSPPRNATLYFPVDPQDNGRYNYKIEGTRMHKPTRALAVLAAIVWYSQAHSAVSLLKDINQGAYPGFANAGNFIAAHGLTFFVA